MSGGTARQTLAAASREARLNSFNGANRLLDALADCWLAESEAHFHVGDDADSVRFVYEMLGMEDAPHVRAARAYLDGESA